MPLKRWTAALLSAALLVGVGACSKPTKKAASKAETSASADSVEGAPSAPSAAAVNDAAPATTARAAIPRESLQPPPLTAPADAQAGPGGVRYQLLRAGTGDSPDAVDTIVVDFSMWTADGQLAASSYPENAPQGFSISSLAPNLRSLLTHLKVGSRVRFWVPRAALQGWKPTEWPDADLVFELDLLSVSHAQVRDSSGNSIVPIPGRPPDAAGPPKGAETTPSGLSYVYLARGNDNITPNVDDHVDVVATAYIIDGIEVKVLSRGIKTGTTLVRAPGKLGEILKHLHTGDQVRIWLPKGQGRAIIPEAGESETILDLSISF